MSHFKGPDLAAELPEFQPNTSVLDLLVESLKRNGDATALIEGQTGKDASFLDILQQSTAISVGLREVGVTAGDYVILCCDKSIAAYSALLGVIFTGATAVLYPTPHADSVPKLTRGFPIKAVFCDRQYHNTLTKSMKELAPQPILVAVMEPQDKVFTSLMSTKGNLQLYNVKDVKKHILMILFSSGTTGDPKGIEISNVGVQLCGRYLKVEIDTLFLSTPIFWLSALITAMTSVFKKFKIILSNSTDPKVNLKLLEKYKVNLWWSGTGSLPGYLNELSRSKYDFSSLEAMCIGGEIMLSSVVEDLKVKVLRDKVKMLTGLASTEAGMLCMGDLDSEEMKFPFGLCGKLNAGVEIKITGDDGNVLPVGDLGEVYVKSPGMTPGYWGYPELNQINSNEITSDDGNVVPVGDLGEVYVRSPGMTPGYWGRPEINREVFHKNGFFRSGDVGFFNQEGELFLRGRVADQINYKGTKVSSAEVEDVLMSHPAVLEAAVVGKPHPSDIEHMTAYVVKKPGHGVTEKELQSLVDGSVADNLRLRGGIYFLDILPRTIIGKVIRKKLREM